MVMTYHWVAKNSALLADLQDFRHQRVDTAAPRGLPRSNYRSSFLPLSTGFRRGMGGRDWGLSTGDRPRFILLTDTFDWGPVALEHVFLVTGCWFLFRFGSRRSRMSGYGTLRRDFFASAWRFGTRRFSSWALSGVVVGGIAGLLAGNQALAKTARASRGRCGHF